jgi:hypothetical protein
VHSLGALTSGVYLGRMRRVQRQFAPLDWARPHTCIRMATEPLTIDRLERWAFFGAHWQVVKVSSDRVVVDLCACTGELVERVECGDAVVIEYLRAARSDLE